MEQFIEAMNEWYNELVEEQRAATPEVASQLRYVLSHIADARRIVKRLVQEAEDQEPNLEKDWTAFVEHVNNKPWQDDNSGTFKPGKVKWGRAGPGQGSVEEGQPVDDVLPTLS